MVFSLMVLIVLHVILFAKNAEHRVQIVLYAMQIKIEYLIPLIVNVRLVFMKI